MDKRDLTQVLGDLDRALATPCEVVIVGGAAMILHFGARRATRDVDVLVLGGDVAELRRAISAAAEQHHLPGNWMSDAVKGFADVLPPDFRERLVPIGLPLERLRLYALGRPDQVAMKIVGLRDQDLEDLELLLPRMSPSDRRVLVGIMDHVATIRPDWGQKIRYFLLEQGWAID